ncbi:protein PTST, chloroplastic-like [Actinidia eriantha]|uniref:protein PTST, chloroplastic-like n=1 Tax=Actinidia eriantha TaxID=165200 RepID=UPI00258AD510|nr:protein PTST, chloroplastic-like [Actinidia eriantha]
MGSHLLIYPKLASTGKNYIRHISWRTFSLSVSLEEASLSPESENYSSDNEDASKTSPEELLIKPLRRDELLLWLHWQKKFLNMKFQRVQERLMGNTFSLTFSRLNAVSEKLMEQIKDVDAAKSKEVPLFWFGMAESVQVMGTFDGWIQGEHLSPEYTGSYTKFSMTLLLRPGRYEIKFLVDGEWHLSSEFPTVGDEPMKNNLLIVE